MSQPPAASSDPSVVFVPVDRALGGRLGPALAATEPWSVLNYSAEHLSNYLTGEDPLLLRMAAMVNGEPAGVAGVRLRWLRGPYLQLLAVLPPFQGRGIGAALLHWFEAQATSADRWLWLCCSDFNTRAFAFYQAHGYTEAATLSDVAFDGRDEILMRKRCV